MSIKQKIKNLGISGVLHFTRGDNLVGILQRGGVLSRTKLTAERAPSHHLEYVGDSAWPDRSRDKDWWGYVNLSIEAVNETLLKKARTNHPEQGWFILSFKPDILEHENIYFTSTNNAYAPHVLRDIGLTGLNLSYSLSYKDLNGNIHQRHNMLPKQYPSSQQAEVLYPDFLSLTHLDAIYVEDKAGFLHANVALSSQQYIGVTAGVNLIPIVAPQKFLAHPNQERY